MRYESITKNVNQWVKIRPALQVYVDKPSVMLDVTVEDAWWLHDLAEKTVKLRSRDTDHTRAIGLDYIHNYMADPDGPTTLGTTGILVLNAQLLLYRGELLVEPNSGPGVPLKQFVPAVRRADFLKGAAAVFAANQLAMKRELFATSHDGFLAADRAFAELPQSFSVLAKEMAQQQTPFEIQIRRKDFGLAVFIHGWWVTIHWQRGGTLAASRLRVRRWATYPQWPEFRSGGDEMCTQERDYVFGLAMDSQSAWMLKGDPNRSETSFDIAMGLVSDLIKKRGRCQPAEFPPS